MSASQSGTCEPAQTRVTGGVRTLSDLLSLALDGAVLRSDLAFGDRLTVRTRNSVYRLWALGDGTFAVAGGWFDQQQLSPATVGVNGCTYGGTVLHQDVVAAPGLFLEFGNAVSTTRIASVSVERQSPPVS